MELCPDCQKKILGGECLGCRIHKLQAENKRLKDALEHIVEYWNKDENSGAMSDALWHILETAKQALQEKPK